MGSVLDQEITTTTTTTATRNGQSGPYVETTCIESSAHSQPSGWPHVSGPSDAELYADARYWSKPSRCPSGSSHYQSRQ